MEGQGVQVTTAIAEKTVRLLKSAIAVVSAKVVVARTEEQVRKTSYIKT